MAAMTKEELNQSLWATAVRLESFSYFDLCAETGRSEKVVRAAIKGWEEQRKVKRLGAGAKNRIVFRVLEGRELIARDIGPLGNMWTAMRGLKTFSPIDISAHASTDAVGVSIDDARAYCGTLLRAGYLKELRKASPRKHEATYRIVKNTGPKAPRVRRVRVVFDENLGEVTHMGSLS
jgi:hypothetical protein